MKIAYQPNILTWTLFLNTRIEDFVFLIQFQLKHDVVRQKEKFIKNVGEISIFPILKGQNHNFERNFILLQISLTKFLSPLRLLLFCWRRRPAEKLRDIPQKKKKKGKMQKLTLPYCWTLELFKNNLSTMAWVSQLQLIPQVIEKN